MHDSLKRGALRQIAMYGVVLAAACGLDDRDVDVQSSPNPVAMGMGGSAAGVGNRGAEMRGASASAGSTNTGDPASSGASADGASAAGAVPIDEGAPVPQEGSAGAPGAVVLTLTVDGDGVGEVTLSAAGQPPVLCSEPCSLEVAPGTTVTASAAPGLNSELVGWSNPLCGAASECTLQLDASTALGVEFLLSYDVAFVSSASYFPSQLPRAGAPANAECARLAAASGLHGERWVAWLAAEGPTIQATDDVSPIEFFQHTGGWVRTDGKPIARSLAALIRGELLHPINRTESNEPNPFNGAWSATTLDGNAQRFALGVNDCQNWTSNDGATFGGDTLVNGVGDVWAGFFSTPCSQALPLTCFADDSDQEVPIVPVAGRLAFLSGSNFTPGAGVAAADSLCQLDACEAGLTGGTDCASAPGTQRTFLAYLHTQSQPAWERFDLTGPTWVRPDGVAWMPEAAELANDGSGQLTSLNVTLDLQYTGGPRTVWVGDPGGAATCLSWTSSDPAQLGNLSIYDVANGTPLSGFVTSDCVQSGRVYCLER
jgi:hypothetical protein